MRIGLIGDIHGNLFALETVLAELEREPLDQLICLGDVAALILEDANLDRVLLLAFLVERDLIVTRHRQPQRVADRRHPHAEIGGAFAIDGNVNLRIGDVEVDLRLGDAANVLRGSKCTLGVLADLIEIRPEDLQGNRE